MYWRRWWWWWWWWWYWYYSQTVRHEAGLCLLHSPCDHQGWTEEPCLVLLIRQSAQPARTTQHQAPPQHLQLSSLLAGVEGGWLSHDGGDGAGCQRIDWLCWSVVYSGSTSYTVHHTVHPTPPHSHKERNGTLWTVMKDLTSDNSYDSRRIVWDLILRLEECPDSLL